LPDYDSSSDSEADAIPDDALPATGMKDMQINVEITDRKTN